MRTILAAVTAAAMSLALAGPAAAFDQRNPADVLSVINASGATATMQKPAGKAPYIEGRSGQLTFETQFYNCNEAKSLCGTVVYTANWDTKDVSLQEINGWNQWVFLCPAYLTSDGQPMLWYGLKAFADDSREQATASFEDWQDCLTQFHDFVGDPQAFLKAHM
jgi:hypothetical protein